jgi:tetratricopeptide (TPR) repeat protein
MAVAAAGFVAGRAPLGSRRAAFAGFGRGIGRAPRYLLAAASVVVALACAWAIWQPQRSDAENNRALDLLDKHQLTAAASAAGHARRIDPLSPDPVLAAASIEDARGFRHAALATLITAVRRFPGEPQVWLALAEYQLDTLDKPADALQTLRGAVYLDPRSRAVQNLFLLARQRLSAAGQAGTARAPVTPGRTPGPTPGRPAVPSAPGRPAPVPATPTPGQPKG